MKININDPEVMFFIDGYINCILQNDIIILKTTKKECLKIYDSLNAINKIDNQEYGIDENLKLLFIKLTEDQLKWIKNNKDNL